MKKGWETILDVMQSKSFADILKDIAQIFFATIFVGFWVSDEISISLMVTGLVLSLIFWGFNLVIIRRYKAR